MLTFYVDHLPLAFEGEGGVFNKLCLGLHPIQVEGGKVLLLDNQISQGPRYEDLKEDKKQCFA